MLKFFFAETNFQQSAETTQSTDCRRKLTDWLLVVGMIHGLAGSGALTLLVASSITSPSIALLFIAVFDIGSIRGMMLVSLLFGLPLHFTAHRFKRFNFGLRLIAGVFSFAFGLFVLYETTTPLWG